MFDKVFTRKAKLKGHPVATRLNHNDIDKKEARRIINVYRALSDMTGGKGFRQPSFKAGPVRNMTIWDSLGFIAFGEMALPKPLGGRRKMSIPNEMTPEEKRADYLKRVRETKGNLPTGDRRLRA